jgi:poly-gamma-glutamate synthesis protein (capsule biosynthesis protein)
MYDYTKAFMDVAPIFSQADLALLNFEGNVCGIPYGTQSRSAPQEMIAALKQAGIDLVQMANSCSISNGLIGLQSTLNNIRAMGIEPLGAFSSTSEFNRTKGYTVVTVNDVKIVFVAFTKGVGSLGLPAGSEDCVNLLYTDYSSTYQKVDEAGITRVMNAVAAQQPDIVIAMLHWGSELNAQISKTQTKIVKLLDTLGADAIIGTHSHYVQKMGFDKDTGMFVAYSLGDFLGDGVDAGTDYSVLLDLEITKNARTGKTTITGFQPVPIYRWQDQNGLRLMRIYEAVKAYEDRCIGAVPEQVYLAMKDALAKVESRVEQ